MLLEICGYLKNFFVDTNYTGHITVVDGTVFCDGKEIAIAQDQYFTLVNEKAKSILGIYKYGKGELKDRDIAGAVWLMDVPDDLLALAGEITAWMEKYGGVESMALSPFNSESFAGYSYSKASGSSSDNSNNGTPMWVSQFGGRLARWRRI